MVATDVFLSFQCCLVSVEYLLTHNIYVYPSADTLPHTFSHCIHPQYSFLAVTLALQRSQPNSHRQKLWNLL